jgi:hypothetical protein
MGNQPLDLSALFSLLAAVFFERFFHAFCVLAFG